MEKDIFIKRSEIEPQNLIINKKDILKTIPSTAVRKKNNKLGETNSEWRWRIFKFPHKENEVIEISFKRPGDKRHYINKMGEWVTKEIGSEFDQFVIEEYYDYNHE